MQRTFLYNTLNLLEKQKSMEYDSMLYINIFLHLICRLLRVAVEQNYITRDTMQYCLDTIQNCHDLIEEIIQDCLDYALNYMARPEVLENSIVVHNCINHVNDIQIQQLRYLGRKHIQFLIKMIEDNDMRLKSINLSSYKLTKDDIKPLLKTLADNPAAAARILSIDVSNNQLSGSIEIPETLILLAHLNLNNNRLSTINISSGLMENFLDASEWGGGLSLYSNPFTLATVIALRKFMAVNPEIDVFGLPSLTDNMQDDQLTLDILQEHFDTIFEDAMEDPQSPRNMRTMLNRIQNGKLPKELTQMTLDYLLHPDLYSSLIIPQIQWLKDMLPGQQSIIDDYIASDRFKKFESAIKIKGGDTAYEDIAKTRERIRAIRICAGRPTGYTPFSDRKFMSGSLFYAYRMNRQLTNPNDLVLQDGVTPPNREIVGYRG